MSYRQTLWTLLLYNENIAERNMIHGEAQGILILHELNSLEGFGNSVRSQDVEVCFWITCIKLQNHMSNIRLDLYGICVPAKNTIR